MYNSLRLPFAFDKGRRLLVAAKSIIFFAMVERRFYKGFLRKRAFLTWCFVVKLWWFGGESW
jgi:hypothetical protein